MRASHRAPEPTAPRRVVTPPRRASVVPFMRTSTTWVHSAPRSSSYALPRSESPRTAVPPSRCPRRSSPSSQRSGQPGGSPLRPTASHHVLEHHRSSPPVNFRIPPRDLMARSYSLAPAENRPRRHRFHSGELPFDSLLQEHPLTSPDFLPPLTLALPFPQRRRRVSSAASHRVLVAGPPWSIPVFTNRYGKLPTTHICSCKR